MTDRSSRDTEYVLVRDTKPKKATRYYYDADDDNESQTGANTRRIIRTKPTKEHRIRYVTADELESDYRRPRVAKSKDRGVKIRNTTDGDQVVLDENDNVIKIIRNNRLPTPPPVENRRIKVRPRETRTVYYQTSDGRLIAHPSINASSPRIKNDFVYAEDEPTKVIRKVIVDPRTGDRENIYEKEKPKRQVQPKYVIRKHPTEAPVETENDDEEEQQQQQQQPQPQYVQVVQRRAVPKEEAPTTKYVMVRKKVDSEAAYAVQSSLPTMKTNRRIVYESPTRKEPTTYVYASNGKYYK